MERRWVPWVLVLLIWQLLLTARVCGVCTGKCVVFDDCFNHSVWHHGSTERTVLLLDIWHWELSAQERESIQNLFQGIQ